MPFRWGKDLDRTLRRASEEVATVKL